MPTAEPIRKTRWRIPPSPGSPRRAPCRSRPTLCCHGPCARSAFASGTRCRITARISTQVCSIAGSGWLVGSAHDHALRLRGGDRRAHAHHPRVPASCECGHQRIPGVGRRRPAYLHGIAGVHICTASPACISARHRRAGTNRRTRSPRPGSRRESRRPAACLGSRRESRRSAAWSCPSSAAMTIRLHGGVLYRQLRQTPARRAGVAGRRRSRALNCGQKENPAA